MNAMVSSILSVLAIIAAILAYFFAARMYFARLQHEKEGMNVLKKQKQMLKEMSEFNTQLIAQTLQISPQFALKPYPQLIPDISPSKMSIFDLRCSHYTPEKELLAEQVVKNIIEQIDVGLGGDNKFTIILILDAGTTVFNIFKELCEHPSFHYFQDNADRLFIITNNLPGVSELIKHRRYVKPGHPGTIFKCRVVSGIANAQYEASIGPDTAQDLINSVGEIKEEIRAKNKKKVKVIGVVTGNYISLVDGLLSDDINHLETKKTIIEISDEVYVVAPLGKIVPFDCDKLNNMIKKSDPKLTYSPVPGWDIGSKEINLFVSIRSDDYFSNLEPPTLRTYLGHVQSELLNRFDRTKLYTPLFQPLEDLHLNIRAAILTVTRALREYEFPHKAFRESLVEKINE